MEGPLAVTCTSLPLLVCGYPGTRPPSPLVHSYLYEPALPGGAVLHGELAAQLGRVLPPPALLHRLFDAVVQRFALEQSVSSLFSLTLTSRGTSKLFR